MYISNRTGIAEAMNNFFCTIGETLSEKIPHTKNPLLESEYNVNQQIAKFRFHTIDNYHLGKVLGKKKTSKGVESMTLLAIF